jgi:hypothetical protein
MKKYLFFLTLSVGCLTVLAQTDKEPFLVKQLSNQTINNAQVETSGGSISVEGVDASKARVEVYITPSNYKRTNSISKEEIQKRLDTDYDLSINSSNGKVTAIAKSKHQIRDWKKALNISFRVYIAKDASTDLSTSGGSISLTNLSGKEDFSTSGGSLSIDHVSGKISGRTSGGSIEVKDSHDDIDLNTSGGSIDASNCDGTLKLTTSGGSLELVNLKGNINATTSGGGIEGKNIEGELRAHTSGGSIQFENLSCSLETSTSGGSIDISMTSLGKYLKVRNSGGNINLQIPSNKGMDLDMNAQNIKTSHLNNFSGNMEEDQIKGKLNGGGIPVTVVAGSGRIHLTIK